jgi:hypothetical protein
MLSRWVHTIIALLGLWATNAYAQAGPGPVPYRGVNNWNLIFGTDNTYDIGASGATRPRTGYFGTSVVTPALTVSGLTSGRVPFASSGGLLADDADLTFATDTLTATKHAGPSAAACSTIAYGFTGDADTGLCSTGADTLGLRAGGTNRLTISTSAITSTLNITLPNDGLLQGTSAGGGFQPYSTVQTPDATQILPIAAANAVQVRQLSLINDSGNGLCGTGACASVAAIIKSATNGDATQYNHLNYYGSGGGSLTTLTDNTATTFFHTPTIAAAGVYAGNGTYVVKVIDAAGEVQVASGSYAFYAVRGNTGGTVCAIQEVGHDGTNPGLPLKVTSSGTLTVALSCTVASNVASFKMTADTSLTATTFNLTGQFNLRTGPAELIPQ